MLGAALLLTIALLPGLAANVENWVRIRRIGTSNPTFNSRRSRFRVIEELPLLPELAGRCEAGICYPAYVEIDDSCLQLSGRMPSPPSVAGANLETVISLRAERYRTLIERYYRQKGTVVPAWVHLPQNDMAFLKYTCKPGYQYRRRQVKYLFC